jgi:hypothetical protein
MEKDYIPLDTFDDKFMQENREHTKEQTDILCSAYKGLTEFLAELPEGINIDGAYTDVLSIMEFARTGDYVDRTRVENMVEEDYKWQPRPVVVSEDLGDDDYAVGGRHADLSIK